ncbi:winged helix-turn-helix transcriptional regulator [bacterium]|jgi:predicted ArsR family transcriptional regulator|nr:winged helix-turn-helix transcriptional regulator [bacterium]
MLNYLFGSKHTEVILFVIHKKKRCYANDLADRLQVAVNGVQYTLEKLEKGGLLVSEKIGKTRVFTLNEEYPLHKELKTLARKAYDLMPESEKIKFENKLLKKRRKTKPPTQVSNQVEKLWSQLKGFKTILDRF